MSQADLQIPRSSGATFRGNIEAALQALVTNSAGTTEPSDTYPYMKWADINNKLVKQRNADNTAWVTIGTINSDGTFLMHADVIKASPTGALTATTVAGQLAQIAAGGIGGGGTGSKSVDGGNATSVYLDTQVYDGGGANG